jgi:DNA polymerase elongation subunit (family B)
MFRKLLRTRDSDLLKEFPDYTRGELREMKRNIPLARVKTLTFDIETAQMKVKVWQLRGNEYIEPTRIIDDWFMVCWSGKWVNGKLIKDVLTPSEAKKGDDERIVRSLWKALNEADFVVGHNIDAFDLKKAQTRFIKYGLLTPNYFKTIDTLKVARKYFRISSNKLDYVCKFIGLEGKLSTGGIDLWDKSESGDSQALKKMSKYCDNDVRITERLFFKLVPYIKNFPLV